MRHPDRTQDFIDDTGLPFSYVIALFEDNFGDPPEDRGLARQYWEAVDEPDEPVTLDIPQATLGATPFSGSPVPGKCVLSPAMEMLECTEGEDQDDWAFDVIREHAGL